jgi:hypothetical protein
MATEKVEVSKIRINRAPVLTLWAAVVAERLGYAWAEALTLGKAVAGLNAQSKGRRLGIYGPKAKAAKAAERGRPKAAPQRVELLHRAIPVRRTSAGVRAVEKDTAISPQTVERYLHAKFKDGYGPARAAFRKLAKSRGKQALAEEAYGLYEHFRPSIPAGRKGWGAAGTLDLEKIRGLAEK